MKYIEDEDKTKLFRIGLKIDQLRRINTEIRDFFIKEGEPVYEGAQEILDVIRLHSRGETPDEIGESVFQSDGEPVVRLLKLFGVHANVRKKYQNPYALVTNPVLTNGAFLEVNHVEQD